MKDFLLKTKCFFCEDIFKGLILLSLLHFIIYKTLLHPEVYYPSEEEIEYLVGDFD